MRSWYHHLRRLLARAAGAAHPRPGRRPAVRLMVEGLEERRVPAGATRLQGFYDFRQGQNIANGVGIFPEISAPDVLTALKANGQALDGVAGPALPATMWIVNGNGERERVPVVVVQDPAVPGMVEVQLRQNLHIGQTEGKHLVKIVIPGVRDAASGDGPLEIEMKVFKTHRRRGRPKVILFNNPVPPTNNPQPPTNNPPQGLGLGGLGGLGGFGGIGNIG